MLYCVFSLESSAKHNKKAVQCTAVFVIRATICEQAPIVPFTTKATLLSGFLVALCARDSGGIRTHDPQLRRLLLYPTELRNQTVYFLRTQTKIPPPSSNAAEPISGFEPETPSLRVKCSTAELNRHGILRFRVANIAKISRFR